MIVRYVVRMENGSYMVQSIDESNSNIIHLTTTDNPIDADLLNSKDVAERCVRDISAGNTNLLVLYDEENPPKDVVRLEINYQIKECTV